MTKTSPAVEPPLPEGFLYPSANEAPAVTTVFTELLKRGPVARIEVAQRTGLSQAAVTKSVNRLILRGLITTHDVEPATTPGRPVQPISVVEHARLMIGVLMRVDEIYVVVTTVRGNIIHSVNRPLASIAVAHVVNTISDTVDSLLVTLGPMAGRVIGIGVACSGDVDSANGVVRFSPRFNWSQVNLRSELAKRFTFPVVIENDVRALAIAEEWFGIGVDTTSFAIVTIGAGIGCGLFVNGDVIEGAHGVAGELGHLPLAPQDALCSCGRYGCVEAVASSDAILNRIRVKKGDSRLTMQDAVELAHSGDDDSRVVFEEAGSMIGLAVAAMVNLVGPGVVLVAGESVTNYDLFGTRIREAFNEHAFGSARDCRIITRTHTFEDWARGAAASVVRSMLARTVGP